MAMVNLFEKNETQTQQSLCLSKKMLNVLDHQTDYMSRQKQQQQQFIINFDYDEVNYIVVWLELNTFQYTYSSWSSMPLSSWPDEELAHCPPVDLFAGKPNSRSACSGNGVGVSKTSVSTIDPFDEPNDTLHEKRGNNSQKSLKSNSFYIIFYILYI